MADAARTNREEQSHSVSGFSLMEPAQKLGGYPKKVQSFLHDVRVEMRQVNWLSRQDVMSTTIVVSITVAFFGAYFFLVDSAVSNMIQRVLKYFR